LGIGVRGLGGERERGEREETEVKDKEKELARVDTGAE